TPKDNIHAIHEHLAADNAIIVFPAGEVSRIRPAGVRDPKWQTGFLRFAQNAKAPIGCSAYMNR
ncbi:MAG: hypothetical protein VX007_08345, partial [Pseudomonadota bacterium]|nr:hypothetical protein [Pseudomonadota bacterium]